jgi:hypothetical protein
MIVMFVSIPSDAACMPIALIRGFVLAEQWEIRRLGGLGKFFHSLPKYRFFACFCQFLMA